MFVYLLKVFQLHTNTQHFSKKKNLPQEALSEVEASTCVQATHKWAVSSKCLAALAPTTSRVRDATSVGSLGSEGTAAPSSGLARALTLLLANTFRGL